METFDDWRSETKCRLEKSQIYNLLSNKCNSDPFGHQVLTQIDNNVYNAYHRTKTIIKNTSEYTLHDSEHLFRVLKIMENLIPVETLTNLSVPELMLLVLSAFYHDIGMAPSEFDVLAWKGDWASDEPTQEESEEHNKFAKYLNAKPEYSSKIERLLAEGEIQSAVNIRDFIIAQYIRETHAKRSSEIIYDELNDLSYRDTNLCQELAILCNSHIDDPLSLLSLDSSFPCGQDIFICLPFIAVILRLSDILDFDSKRTPKVLFNHLAIRHPVSLAEWKKHRAINSSLVSYKAIAFVAKCEHPAIEAAIHEYCDIIDKELLACSTILGRLTDVIRSPFPSYYKISFPVKVERSKIGPKTEKSGDPIYSYRGTKFTLSHSKIINLLMGSELYNDPNVPLRELIQNSIDACMLRKELEKSWKTKYEPAIGIIFHSANGEDMLTVTDNGVGMDQNIIDNYYSKIGACYYKSPEFYKIQAELGIHMKPISRFGIGILSCFLVSNSLIVETRRILGPNESGEPIKISVEGTESVFWIRKGQRLQAGTTTELILNQNHPWNELQPDDVISAIKKVIPNPPFPIRIVVGDNDISYSKKEFLNMYSLEWGTKEHCFRLELDITDRSFGAEGFALIALVDDDDRPVKRKILFSSNAMIDGFEELYNLESDIEIIGNELLKSNTSLEADDGNIKEAWDSSTYLKSVSNLSVHGISVPTTIFPQDIDNVSARKAELVLPFPIYLQVDIINENDLDLNTARTEIVKNEKWFNFAEGITYIILQRIGQKYGAEFLYNFIKIIPSTDDDTFCNAVSKVAAEFSIDLNKYEDE